MSIRSHIGFKFRTDIEYMTPAERAQMKELLNAGIITFFKLGSCEVKGCDKDVIRGKRWCSIECYEKPKDAGGSGENEMDMGD